VKTEKPCLMSVLRGDYGPRGGKGSSKKERKDLSTATEEMSVAKSRLGSPSGN